MVNIVQRNALTLKDWVTWMLNRCAEDDKACCNLQDGGSGVLHHHIGEESTVSVMDGEEQNGMIQIWPHRRGKHRLGNGWRGGWMSIQY
jgi:hypothetical protein